MILTFFKILAMMLLSVHLYTSDNYCDAHSDVCNYNTPYSGPELKKRLQQNSSFVLFYYYTKILLKEHEGKYMVPGTQCIEGGSYTHESHMKDIVRTTFSHISKENEFNGVFSNYKEVENTHTCELKYKSLYSVRLQNKVPLSDGWKLIETSDLPDNAKYDCPLVNTEILTQQLRRQINQLSNESIEPSTSCCQVS